MVAEDDKDVWRSYHMGAKSYISKPAGYGELVRIMAGLCVYWFDTVTVPCAALRVHAA